MSLSRRRSTCGVASSSSMAKSVLKADLSCGDSSSSAFSSNAPLATGKRGGVLVATSGGAVAISSVATKSEVNAVVKVGAGALGSTDKTGAAATTTGAGSAAGRIVGIGGSVDMAERAGWTCGVDGGGVSIPENGKSTTPAAGASSSRNESNVMSLKPPVKPGLKGALILRPTTSLVVGGASAARGSPSGPASSIERSFVRTVERSCPSIAIV